MKRGAGLTHSFLPAWLVASLVIFGLTVAWSFATPLGAASDEPAHIIKAAAVVRGEFLGQPTPAARNADRAHTGRAVMTVVVPATYGHDAFLGKCYQFNVKVTAVCAPGASTSGRLVSATTYVGRYPPFYYLMVGSPSLVWHSSAGIYLMRVLSALLSSALLGLALATAAVWSRRRLLVGAVAVAATPMVIFLASVVNPSGLEIASSIAVWTTGLVLVEDRRDDPPPGLIPAFFICACVLAVTRSLSPMWLVIILLALVCLEPRGVGLLLKRRAVRVWAVVTLVVSILAVVYIASADALAITASGNPLKPDATAMTVVNLYLNHASFYLYQTVGVFGSALRPSAPFYVVLLIGAAVVTLVWMALVTAVRRHILVLVGLLGLSLVLPIVIDVKNALQLHNDVWQSRYALPLFVGVPLVSAAVAGRRRPITPVAVRRMQVGAATIVVFAQWVCFYDALHRYTVGIDGPFGLTLRIPGGWTPPLPAALLVLVAAIMSLTYGLVVARFLDPGGDGGDNGEGLDAPAGTAKPATLIAG